MTDFLTYIFVLAGIQGVLLFTLLYARKQNHSANLILGAAVLILSLDLFLNAVFLKEWYLNFPHLLGINYGFPFLYGPLFYLYIRALTAADQKPDSKKLLHFIPYAAVLLFMLPDFLLNGKDKILFVQGLMKDEPLGYQIFDHLKPVHGIIYTLLTIKQVKVHNCRIKDSFSSVDKINLVWFRNLVAWLVVVWGVVVVTFIVDDFFNTKFTAYDSIIYFVISIMVYVIGYMGLRQPEIFQQCLAHCYESENKEGERRYRKSGLSDEAAEEISKRLLDLMETEKPYLNSELTLRVLSEKLNVSQHNLSELINTKLGQSFF